MAFLPTRPTPEHEVRHLDGDPGNNSPKNLAWGTRLENAADKVRHGRSTSGERNPKARITASIAVAIRSLVAGGLSQEKAGTMHGITQTQVSRIVRGEHWKQSSEARP